MKEDVILRTERLHFSYRGEAGVIPIIRGIDLQIHRGEMTALCGPSGSGKSTLLYLLSGLLKNDSGQVHFDGHHLNTLSSSELSILRNQHIGFVFQQFHLLPKLNVLENILLPATYAHHLPQKDMKARARELAGKVGLQDRLDHLPSQLSGGQQQRVSIARALLMKPSLILADEPTGNLDSQTSGEILEIFRELIREGTTVVLITHDQEVAKKCDREIFFRDGKIQEEHRYQQSQSVQKKSPPQEKFSTEKKESFFGNIWLFIQSYLDFQILRSGQNRGRTILTMVGVIVGVAAVLVMLTMGRFAKDQILNSYAEIGVNTVVFDGYQNWRLKTTEKVPAAFREFQWEQDLKPLFKIFPFIQAMSPILDTSTSGLSYSGQTLNEESTLSGVNEWALPIINRKVILGSGISYFHIENRSPVCLVGIQIIQKLFRNRAPIGETLNLVMNEDGAACQIIGVLEPRSSSQSRRHPDMEIYMPYTTLQTMITNSWQRRVQRVYMRVHPSAPMDKFAQILPKYFEQKYGKSGNFFVNSNSQLIAQMQKFLTIFTWLLASVAMVTLAVGGMGITNMMLVSVNERFREIGIRKAVGATNASIRKQFLRESITVCLAAGVLGIIAGFVFYEGALWFASKLTDKIAFQWLFDPFAFALSLVSILAVGIFSGLFPAIKAEKLQVIEALRSE